MAVQVYEFEVVHVSAFAWINVVLLDLLFIEEVFSAARAQTVLARGDFSPFLAPHGASFCCNPVLPVRPEVWVVWGCVPFDHRVPSHFGPVKPPDILVAWFIAKHPLFPPFLDELSEIAFLAPARGFVLVFALGVSPFANPHPGVQALEGFFGYNVPVAVCPAAYNAVEDWYTVVEGSFPNAFVPFLPELFL
jgi:hypothetical protein